MKLCLDEQMSKRVAEQLRKKGYDVVAITETDLGNRKTQDEPVLLWAVSQQRVLATYNIRDFGPMVTEFYAIGQEHYGVILISEYTIPQRDVGKQVKALEQLLKIYPDKDDLKNQSLFLEGES